MSQSKHNSMSYTRDIKIQRFWALKDRQIYTGKNTKKAGVVILISDKVGYRTKIIKWEGKSTL